MYWRAGVGKQNIRCMQDVLRRRVFIKSVYRGNYNSLSAATNGRLADECWRGFLRAAGRPIVCTRDAAVSVTALTLIPFVFVALNHKPISETGFYIMLARASLYRVHNLNSRLLLLISESCRVDLRLGRL